MIIDIRKLFAAHSSLSLRVFLVSALSIPSIGCGSLVHGPKGEPVAGTTTSTYQCTNSIEIQCDASGCVSTDRGNFTPMQVEFDVVEGNLSVCAYTGCWESPATVHNTGQFTLLVAEKVRFSTAPHSGAAIQNIAITFDRVDSIAILKLGEFAQPMRCGIASRTD